MTCTHKGAHIVVWNELATNEKGEGGGMLTVAWCPDCGAIKRQFPKLTIDWEIPTLAREHNEIVDWKRSG